MTRITTIIHRPLMITILQSATPRHRARWKLSAHPALVHLPRDTPTVPTPQLSVELAASGLVSKDMTELGDSKFKGTQQV